MIGMSGGQTGNDFSAIKEVDDQDAELTLLSFINDKNTQAQLLAKFRFIISDSSDQLKAN